MEILSLKKAKKNSEFIQNSVCFLQEKSMSQKEKPKKKEDSKKSSDEWKDKPVKKKPLGKAKVKYPKTWFQEEEQ
jgi:hypothetical protein